MAAAPLADEPLGQRKRRRSVSGTTSPLGGHPLVASATSGDVRAFIVALDQFMQSALQYSADRYGLVNWEYHAAYTAYRQPLTGAVQAAINSGNAQILSIMDLYSIPASLAPNFVNGRQLSIPIEFSETADVIQRDDIASAVVLLRDVEPAVPNILWRKWLDPRAPTPIFHFVRYIRSPEMATALVRLITTIRNATGLAGMLYHAQDGVMNLATLQTILELATAVRLPKDPFAIAAILAGPTNSDAPFIADVVEIFMRSRLVRDSGLQQTYASGILLVLLANVELTLSTTTRVARFLINEMSADWATVSLAYPNGLYAFLQRPWLLVNLFVAGLTPEYLIKLFNNADESADAAMTRQSVSTLLAFAEFLVSQPFLLPDRPSAQRAAGADLEADLLGRRSAEVRTLHYQIYNRLGSLFRDMLASGNVHDPTFRLRLQDYANRLLAQTVAATSMRREELATALPSAFGPDVLSLIASMEYRRARPTKRRQSISRRA